MRIGILIHKCSGGGAERIAGEVSRMLAEQEEDLVFCTFFKEAEEYPYAGERLSCPNEKRRSIFTFLRRIQWVHHIKKEKKLDQMISFLPQANVINLLTGGSRIVSFRNNPTFLPRSYRVLFRWLLPHADHVVAISKGVEEALKEAYPAIAGKSTTIYNPIKNFPIEERAARPAKRILTIGRLTKQKAHGRTIEAFSKLAKTRPQLRLTIVGSGPLASELTAQAMATGFSDRIKFLPFTHEIEEEYKKADLFVLSSRYEGFGNVILEAMAKGLPVIATDCDYGPREIIAPGTPIDKKAQQLEIHEFGILTPLAKEESETSKNLAAAICRLVDDDELRARLNQAGLKRTHDFTGKEIGQRWRRLLNR